MPGFKVINPRVVAEVKTPLSRPASPTPPKTSVKSPVGLSSHASVKFRYGPPLGQQSLRRFGVGFQSSRVNYSVRLDPPVPLETPSSHRGIKKLLAQPFRVFWYGIQTLYHFWAERPVHPFLFMALPPSKKGVGSPSQGSPELQSQDTVKTPIPSSVDELQIIHRKTVQFLHRNISDPVEKKTYLHDLAEVHQAIKRAKRNKMPEFFQEAWGRLKDVTYNLGGEVVREADGEFQIKSRPKESLPTEVDTENVSPPLDLKKARRAILVQQIEDMKRREAAGLLEEVAGKLADWEKSFQQRESLLPPRVQEKYLQGKRKLKTQQAIWKKELERASENSTRKNSLPLEKIKKGIQDLLARVQTIHTDLLAEPLLEIKAGQMSPHWEVRDYQAKMMAGLKADLETKVSPWLGLASPMQTGKSYLIGPVGELLREHFGRDIRIFILSSARVITGQVMEDLLEGFPISSIGRYDGLVKEPRQITVASIGSFSNHLRDFSNEGPIALINDEAYSTQNPSVAKIYLHFRLAKKIRREGNILIEPRSGPGIVVGLSGTGAGLQGYHLSGELNLKDAINEGWVRHMVADRIFFKSSFQEERHSREEGMIWWKPTVPNAKLLTEVYQEKIRDQYWKTLVFVPTIRHAKLLREAMQEAFGEGFPKTVHSKMEEDAVETEMERWQAEGGALISVKKLSRGFRGTGTDAVFHTYQTTSMELFAQRTGRAWGLPEGVSLPDLYVLEATWSRDVSFANLARLLGLADYPQARLSSRDAPEPKPSPSTPDPEKAERKEAQSVKKGEGKIFHMVPLVEGWRTVFEVILERAGGFQNLAKNTALPLEILSGYALGALPIKLSDLMSLKEHLGGREKAQEIWVRNWEKAVAESLQGDPKGVGRKARALIGWQNSKKPLLEKALDLDDILHSIFIKRATRGYQRFFRFVEKGSQGYLNRKEIGEVLKEAARNFIKVKEEWNEARPFLIRNYLLSVKPLGADKSAQILSEKFRSWVNLTGYRVIWLRNEFEKDLNLAIQSRLRKNLGSLPRTELQLSSATQSVLASANIEHVEDLFSLDDFEIEGLSFEKMREIGDSLEYLGLKPTWDNWDLDSFPIASAGVSEDLIKILTKAGIKSFGEFSRVPYPKLLQLPGFRFEFFEEVSPFVNKVRWRKDFRARDRITKNDLKNLALEQFPFSKKLQKIFQSWGINNFEDLIKIPNEKIIEMPGVGPSFFRECTELIERFDYLFNSTARLNNWIHTFGSNFLRVRNLPIPEIQQQALRNEGIYYLDRLKEKKPAKLLALPELDPEDIELLKKYLSKLIDDLPEEWTP